MFMNKLYDAKRVSLEPHYVTFLPGRRLKSGVKKDHALGEQLNASGWAGISGGLSILLITL